jgi:hypothetical protein
VTSSRDLKQWCSQVDVVGSKLLQQNVATYSTISWLLLKTGEALLGILRQTSALNNFWNARFLKCTPF